MIKTMAIDIKVKPATNVARIDTIDPTYQTQRASKIMIEKLPTRTRRRHVKDKPKKRKIRKKPLNLYKTQILNQVTMINHVFAEFGFCNDGGRHELDLRNILIIRNKSTADLFFNKNIFTRSWATYNSMTFKGNYGSIKTTHKAYVKRYGEVRFNE